MRILKEIHFRDEDGNHVIYFGTVDNNQELQEMFRLRYEVYSKMGYISKDLFHDKIEKDEYDESGKCDYFIAEFNNKIIGSARLIKDNYLPTEKECFKFKEPQEIKEISRDKRGEISRLIIIRDLNKSLPPYLILLGIIDSIIKVAKEKDIRGGYGFIKKSLRKKLKRLSIPFNIIKPFTQIYSKKHLFGYFYNSSDPAFPIYYLREDAEKYLDRIFNHSKIFKRLNNNKFLYLLDKPWKFLFYIKLFHLSYLWK